MITKTKSLNIDKKEIADKKTIAEKFNSCFINEGSKLEAKMTSSNTNFESYLHLKEKEFKDAFFALKTNKSPGYDKLHVKLYWDKFILLRKLCHELQIPLMNIFSLSLKTGIFPEKTKITKVS